MRRAVVAFGGNALVRDEAHASIRDQNDTVATFAPRLVDLVERGWSVVVTHGNGPQVGYILRRSELALAEVAPVPLDFAVGDTQGAIGHMFLTAIRNEMRRRDLDVPVVAVVTQTLVDAADPAFNRPTKPIGAFFDEVTARRHGENFGWTVAEDSGRGWRRTVASPEPIEIVELPTIRRLADDGAIVVACGGGGIPVIRRDDGCWQGVEAVIDKDLASSVLAVGLDAEMLAIPTNIDRAAIGFGRPHQRWIDRLTADEAAALLASGEFGAGSMAPKIEALVRFVRSGPGRVALLSTVDRLIEAFDGDAGTRIFDSPV